MREWLIKLGGKDSDLEDLPHLFNSQEFSVIEENKVFFLKAHELDVLDDVYKILARSRQLLDIISAAASYYFQSFTKLDVTGVFIIDENGNRIEQQYLTPDTGLHVKWKGKTLDDGTFIPANRTRYVDSLVKLSIKFKGVEKCLQFFKEDTWISLYKVFEIIRDDLGSEDELISNKWTTKKIIHQFTGTAQSEDVLGAEARHASKRYRAPKIPMSKFEAHYFVRELLKNWLQTKTI